METRRQKQISLAQNCLKSPKLVHRLVRMSNVGLSDTVYEVGPGNGIITAELASVAREVIAIEKDPELVRHLRERFRAVKNVSIVERDFLNWQTPVSAYRIFANIPYNRTAQIVRKILHDRSGLAEAHLIMQREAARRFSGSPRDTLFSILVKPFFDFQILLQLKRTDFWPIPNADSVLLEIKRHVNPVIAPQDVASYREFVHYGFGRCKPNLKLAFKKIFTYRQWKHFAKDLEFPLNAKPTELSVEQWLGLYQRFKEKSGHGVF